MLRRIKREKAKQVRLLSRLSMENHPPETSDFSSRWMYTDILPWVLVNWLLMSAIRVLPFPPSYLMMWEDILTHPRLYNLYLYGFLPFHKEKYQNKSLSSTTTHMPTPLSCALSLVTQIEGPMAQYCSFRFVTVWPFAFTYRHVAVCASLISPILMRFRIYTRFAYQNIFTFNYPLKDGPWYPTFSSSTYWCN